MHYDADLAPDPQAWLASSVYESGRAVRAWLVRRDLPWPCGEHMADDWREIEDQLAAGYPPEIGRLVGRMLDAGLSRTVAIWALCTLAGGEIFRQHARMTRQSPAGSRLTGLEGLFDERDFSILPSAFQAAGSTGFGAAHAAVIAHHQLHYARGASMGPAEAAGFCLGLAASPRTMPLSEHSEHLLGKPGRAETPAYLPVLEACGRLFQWISDALFEDRDPIPDFCLGPNRESWSRGLRRAMTITRGDWDHHLAAYPALRADYADTVDFLTVFAEREHASDIIGRGEPRAVSPGEEALRATAEMSAAARRLFYLAHPPLLTARTDSA
ncbi:MAG: hypothetical protein GVY32_11220 [Gammaproteobacteria bacterium]|jgi:hypothetical protein|nr:hypothetical protein [Gammaproteobacteria bacterium]